LSWWSMAGWDNMSVLWGFTVSQTVDTVSALVSWYQIMEEFAW